MSLNTHKEPLIKQGWVRALLLFIVYVLFTVLTGLALDYYLLSAKVPEKSQLPEMAGLPAMLYFTASFVIAVVSVFLCRKYLDRRSFLSLGLKAHHFFPGGLIGLLTGIFLVCTGGIVIYYFDALKWVDISFKSEDFFSSAVMLLMVAISEELVFRGYILRNLNKSVDQWLSLLISSCLFALVHISNPGVPVFGMLNIFLGGLVLGLTYMYTRNLWGPILFHFGWNFFQGPVLGFPVSGLPFSSVLTVEETPNYLVNGGDFGFEGSLVCFVLLLIACAFFFLLLLRTVRGKKTIVLPP